MDANNNDLNNTSNKEKDPAKAGQAGAAFRKFICVLCYHVYDEAKGDPEVGIEAGTRWEDVPEDWFCPDCGATKEDFEEMT